MSLPGFPAFLRADGETMHEREEKLSFLLSSLIIVTLFSVFLMPVAAEAEDVSLWTEDFSGEWVVFGNGHVVGIRASVGTVIAEMSKANVSDSGDPEDFIEVLLYDDGTHGDETAYDGVFTGNFTIIDDEGTSGSNTDDTTDTIDIAHGKNAIVTVDLDDDGTPGSAQAEADFSPPDILIENMFIEGSGEVLAVINVTDEHLNESSVGWRWDDGDWEPPVNITSPERFTFFRPYEDLSPGEHFIEVIALDIAGNAMGYTSVFNYPNQSYENILISTPTITPTVPREGDRVTVEMNITNQGDVPVNLHLELRVNGSVEDTDTLTVNGHAYLLWNLTWLDVLEGEYAVEIGVTMPVLPADQMNVDTITVSPQGGEGPIVVGPTEDVTITDDDGEETDWLPFILGGALIVILIGGIAYGISRDKETPSVHTRDDRVYAPDISLGKGFPGGTKAPPVIQEFEHEPKVDPGHPSEGGPSGRGKPSVDDVQLVKEWDKATPRLSDASLKQPPMKPAEGPTIPYVHPPMGPQTTPSTPPPPPESPPPEPSLRPSDAGSGPEPCDDVIPGPEWELPPQPAPAEGPTKPYVHPPMGPQKAHPTPPSSTPEPPVPPIDTIPIPEYPKDMMPPVPPPYHGEETPPPPIEVTPTPPAKKTPFPPATETARPPPVQPAEPTVPSVTPIPVGVPPLTMGRKGKPCKEIIEAAEQSSKDHQELENAKKAAEEAERKGEEARRKAEQAEKEVEEAERKEKEAERKAKEAEEEARKTKEAEEAYTNLVMKLHGIRDKNSDGYKKLEAELEKAKARMKRLQEGGGREAVVDAEQARGRAMDAGVALKKAKWKAAIAKNEANEAKAKANEAREKVREAQEKAFGKNQKAKECNECLDKVKALLAEIAVLRQQYADLKAGKDIASFKEGLSELDIKGVWDDWWDSFKRFRDECRKVKELKGFTDAKLPKEFKGLWDWGGPVGTAVGYGLEEVGGFPILTDAIKAVGELYKVFQAYFDPSTALGARILSDALDTQEVVAAASAFKDFTEVLKKALKSFEQLQKLVELDKKIQSELKKWTDCLNKLPPVPDMPQVDLDALCYKQCLEKLEELLALRARLEELIEQAKKCKPSKLDTLMKEASDLKRELTSMCKKMDRTRKGLKLYLKAHYERLKKKGWRK